MDYVSLGGSGPVVDEIMPRRFSLPCGSAGCIHPYRGAMDFVSLRGSRPVELSCCRHLKKRGGADIDFVVVVNKLGDGTKGVVLLASRKDVFLSVYRLNSWEPMWVDSFWRMGGVGVDLNVNCLAARYVRDDLFIAVGTENGYVSLHRSKDGEMVPFFVLKLYAAARAGFGQSWGSISDAVHALEISPEGHIIVFMAEFVLLCDGKDGKELYLWPIPATHKQNKNYRNVTGQKQWSIIIHESSSGDRVYACCCVLDNYEVAFPNVDGGEGGLSSKRRLCPILLYELSHPFTMQSRHFSQMETCYTQKMSCSALSSDGSTLATGTLDNTICVWDTGSGVLKYSLPCISPVLSVSFLRRKGSSASRYLLSIDEKGNLKLWDNGHYLRGVRTCWTKMTVIDYSSLCFAMWGQSGWCGIDDCPPSVSVVYLGNMLYHIRWQIVLLCELFFRDRAERRVKGDALSRLLCRILPDLYCERDAFRCMLSFII